MKTSPRRLARHAGATALAVALPASADTLLVPGQYPTIQAAIDASRDGDVVLVADGVHRGANFGGKNITVRSQSGPSMCSIEPPGIGFWFKSGEPSTAVLEGFTIQNLQNSLLLGGGGICVDGASPTVRNCAITANAATYRGGGIAIRNGSPRFENCTITYNATGAYTLDPGAGGGVAIDGGAPVFVRCTIMGNRTGEGVASILGSIYAPGGDGGGVRAINASPVFEACQIISNHTGRGGDGDGPPCFGAPLPGTAGGNGAGVYFSGCAGTLVNCLVADNHCGDGGDGGSCTPVSNGGAGGNAGGVLLVSSTTAIINCTIAQNHAGAGGLAGGPSSLPGAAGIGGGVMSSASPSIVNSILWANEAPGSSGQGAQVLFQGGKPSLSYSTIQDWTGKLGGTANSADDPRFYNAAIGDYHLTPGSSCIDSGRTTALPAGIFTDLEGYARFVESPEPNTGSGPAPIVDRGAFEAGFARFCYANCDGSTVPPILNLSDYICFMNRFAAGHPIANCDGSTIAPVLNVNDYMCFQSRFVGGCP